MKPTKNLRLRLRLLEGALLLLLAVFTTAAVSTHQLLLDAANHPTSDFDLASTHVVGTLDDGRLSANVPLIADGNLGLPGTLSWDAGNSNSDGGGSVYLGYSLFIGNHVGNAFIEATSGARLTDNGYGGWSTASSFDVEAPLSAALIALDGDTIYTDGSGNLTIANGTLTIGGAALLDQNGNGNFVGVFTQDINASSHVQASGSVTMFGAPPLVSQPATPTSQAEIIALLQAYGMCQ